MTQEKKILLLQDLCGRLPYGVKVWYKYATWISKKFATSIRLADEKIALSSKFNKEGDWFKKNHFNYRLPEHLFIKVTDVNNPYKT